MEGTESSSMSVSQPFIPIFKDHWDLLKIGYDNNEANESFLRENQKKNWKALFFLQQEVQDIFFSRIAMASTSKEVWEILQKEFMGSIKVIEVKLQTFRQEFEALLMKGGGSKKQDYVGRGCGRGGFCGWGCERGRGKGRFDGQEKQSIGEQRWKKSSIHCHNCKKFGHVNANCWAPHAHYVEKENEESKLFMVHSSSNDIQNDVWFLDSGCSNHMTSNRSLFKELDELQKEQVRLGDNKQIQFEIKGVVVVKTSHGKEKLLYNVFFVPNLAHSLLSVGQLMASGYEILFNDGTCVINDLKSGQSIVSV
ncbi:uncharacterized protein LOC133785446 [Humulus lupulus]|uniref:uncharacterized protein LOC133785446 n=1 Tax=Humulus lupulus TaxID=3486 RepID=UPI002B40AF66|nr:uncharacterized protein LOC133785446 [Humulus lupulus]